MGRDAFEELWMTSTRANISKNDTGYSIELAMSGFKKNEISVNIENNLLKVSAARAIDDRFIIHQELPDHIAERIFELPQNIDQTRIMAELDHGILKISIPQENGARSIARTIEVA